MNHEKQNRILTFWFGDDSLRPLKNRNLWFAKDPKIDDLVRGNFESYLDEAQTGAYDDWAKTPNGALALVILCDQFPRMIFRDDPQAFAYDQRALRASQIAIAAGFDKNYTAVERFFLYMPFEHSEDLDVQNRSIQLFGHLFHESQGDERQFIAEGLDYAIRHHDIIEQFGRFPHRNELLGRENSRAEREFLKRPGSYF